MPLVIDFGQSDGLTALHADRIKVREIKNNVNINLSKNVCEGGRRQTVKEGSASERATEMRNHREQ